ncbi:hypothetical protein WSK_1822 [Novosphingobium sp. Rr 2-17]|uniref:hypothetical protein n=1 Tax=Novosphingobium sp. Rr 2-17 TaxID=555793 RepID=UPI000269AB39|nr:hypothetical protein [Novosphingobium sp. Rr 2-17]EIZ79589.1 hypothetical protein WSK_1822 [Novosphingobium sp. Rr 2-17]
MTKRSAAFPLNVTGVRGSTFVQLSRHHLPRQRWSGAAWIAACGIVSVAVLPRSALAETDLSGTWRIVAPRSSIASENLTIPFTAQGKKQYDENRRKRAKRDLEFDRTASRCAAPGVPRVMLTSKRFQVFQDRDIVMIGFEWNRFRRAIAMPTLPSQFSIFGDQDNAGLVGTKMGTSKGHWEGDTLVIQTSQFSDRTLLDDAVPHGFQLKVTERVRLVAPDTLEDRIKIEDPEYFTRPWETVVTYARQPDAVFPEDNCLDRVSGEPMLPSK